MRREEEEEETSMLAVREGAKLREEVMLGDWSEEFEGSDCEREVDCEVDEFTELAPLDVILGVESVDGTRGDACIGESGSPVRLDRETGAADTGRLRPISVGSALNCGSCRLETEVSLSSSCSCLNCASASSISAWLGPYLNLYSGICFPFVRDVGAPP